MFRLNYSNLTCIGKIFRPSFDHHFGRASALSVSLGSKFFKSTPTSHASEFTSTNSAFTGYIPLAKVSINYSRSSGSGGQNVNKVNSKVSIRFHVESADWIPEKIKEHFFHQEKTKITKDGYYYVTSEKTRKQLLNQADCLEKIRSAVRRAELSIKEESDELNPKVEERKAKARACILREKRIHSLKKESRQAGVASL